MPLTAQYYPHRLRFKFDAGTSRGVLREKATFFVSLASTESPSVLGWGECAPLAKLSIDDCADFEERLRYYLKELEQLENPWDFRSLPGIESYPSIEMGLEVALLDLENGGRKILFSRSFVEEGARIPINGLVWMGDKEFMRKQMQEKLEMGFSCIKMKIGAINFEEELALLAYLRKQFDASTLELRVDANGAFAEGEALERLKRLSEFELHSIEQPIRQGNWEAMARLCEVTPLPIALDEELIGLEARAHKYALLSQIKPQYIILKPTLIGGFQQSGQWIEAAESLNIGWWMTSALEANIGLNAIAQFTASKKVSLPQGLGTGQLFHNNIESPLTVSQGAIFYDSQKGWDIPYK